MGWPAAQAAIVALLEGVTVDNPSDPEAAQLKAGAVYPYPPDSFEQEIAFILFPPGMATNRGSGGVMKVYTLKTSLYVKDENAALAAAILGNFREELADTFTGAVKLHFAADVDRIDGPDFDEGRGAYYGGQVSYLVYDFHIAVYISQRDNPVIAG